MSEGPARVEGTSLAPAGEAARAALGQGRGSIPFAPTVSPLDPAKRDHQTFLQRNAAGFEATWAESAEGLSL